MKVKQLFVILTLLTAAGGVMAQSSFSGKSRAEVVAELKQAVADGRMSVGDAQYPKQPDGGSKGGMAAPSQPVTDETHQKIIPVYAGH